MARYLQVRETPRETSAGHSSGPAAKNNNIKTGFNQLVEVESNFKFNNLFRFYSLKIRH